MNVLTLGTFDLFHAGHVNLLARCRGIAGYGKVVVGLNTDGFVERYKGRPPLVGYKDRLVVLEACRYVDEVTPNDQPDGKAWDVLLAVDPDVIVVGSDWQGRDYLAQLGVDTEWLAGHEIGLIYVPYTPDISSTDIRARIAA